MILVLNSGSSSVKFALLDPASGQRPTAGLAEHVGTAGALLHVRPEQDEAHTERLDAGTYPPVIARILDQLPGAGAGRALAGVGHRVVHGGARFTASVLIDDEVLTAIRSAQLGFLGLAEDPQANAGHGRATGGRISPDGPVQALVVPTDEELMIARDTAQLIATGGTAR